MLGDIGAFLLALGLSSALLSGVAYVVHIRRPDAQPVLNVARSGFYLMVFSIMIASAILMYLILTHQFQYHYVWAHSSTNLGRPFLFAAFYAGQEGSFMLWTLLTALIGVFVIGYAERYRYESETMSVFMLVIALLLLILVFDSPFETIYAALADQMLPAGFIPEDGRGLNPQLENLWITIHPPMLFTGFAAMTVPFVFAIAGLLKKEYQRWISIALPWTLFASMVLGFGIMLGGWWAYETLGWGGYWAWDPVENSSLIPWLICVALLHTMLVQLRTSRQVEGGEQVRTGGLVRTNVILAVLAFAGILYSTFLTRSGVLDDTSVHSFVAPGDFIYSVLQIIMGIFLVIGFGAIIWRWKDLKARTLAMKSDSRENWLGVGSALLLASAFIVTVGTSWPILMPQFGQPKAKLDISFYDSTHIWLVLGILLINGLSVLLQWKGSDLARVKKNLGVVVPLSIAATAIAAFLGGVDDLFFILLLFGAFFALLSNALQGYKFLRKNWRMAGAYVAHLGLTILVLGVIATSGYSTTEHVQLVEGESTDVFGYSVEYKGPVQIELEKKDREKYQHILEFRKGGDLEVVRPVIFWTDFNNREQSFLEPGILYRATSDVYVTPKALAPVGGNPTVVLAKGEQAVVPLDSNYSVRFEKFDMSRAASDSLQGAVVEVITPDSAFYTTVFRRLDGRYRMESVGGTDLQLGFAELQADKTDLAKSKARIAIASSSHPSPPEKRAITVDISIKPFILLVWGGVMIMVVGFFLSILRRRRELVALFRREGADSVADVTPEGGDQSDG